MQAPPTLLGTEFIARVAGCWGRQPVATLPATHRTQVAAALWQDHAGATEELSATVDMAVNALCITCTSSDIETAIDGRMVHRGSVAQGSLNVVRPGERSRGVNRGHWQRLHVYLPTSLLQELAVGAGLARPDQPVELINPLWRQDPAVGRISQDIIAEMRAPAPLARLRLDALSQDLAIIMLRSHSSLARLCQGARQPLRGGLAPWQLKRATAAMEARLDGEIGLDELAALCDLSPAYFSRAFKKTTGQPPFVWLQHRRIAHAKDLLQQARLPLAQVAQAAGFAAQPQFTTAFRRITGTTPAAWQRGARD